MIHLIIGILVVIVNVIIISITVIIVLRYLFNIESRGRIRKNLLEDIFNLSITMLILFFSHLIQIAIWGELFVLCGEFDEFSTAYYHSMVNFSSLGYGDIVMSKSWRLLGAIEAVNGILMFGVSTAVFFSILRYIFQGRVSDMKKRIK